VSPYAAFASRNYRFLLTGAGASMLGQQMLAIVVAWDLYRITHSAIALGNVGLAQVLPVFLFTFIAGHVADRYDRRRTVVITQSAAAIVGLILTFSGAGRSIAMIYSCLFLIATARAFQWPVTASLMPQTVPAETLTNAISWSGSVREFATMAGPAISGLMIAAWGSEPVYLCQAIFSMIAAFSFSRLDVPALPEASRAAPGLAGTLEGLRFVWKEKIVLGAMSLDLFAVLFGGARALLPIYADEILHAGPQGLGWLEAAPAVGAGLMSVGLAHFGTIKKAGRAMLWSVIGFGLATIVFAISKNLWLSLFALFFVGATDAISVVLRLSMVQMRTPQRLRGRVSAVNALFISSSNQWGAVESGVAATLLGTVPSVVFGGIMTCVVVGVIAWSSKALREWEN
jgi:MFS family permease